MSTLRIKIVNSKFVSHNNVNIKLFEEKRVIGNGWEATLSEDGKLECFALQYYDGVLHLVKFKVQRGYARLILKIGENRAKVLKNFKLEKWPENVVLGLPGGYIDNRRPYIRLESFQQFLNEYNISSVRNETANGIYQLIRESKNGKIIYSETIETDGSIKVIFENDEKGFYRYEVTDASWVIKNVLQGEERLRILYTRDDPKLIKNLPKN